MGISIQAMDPNTNKIYLAIGATATILAGALGYYILVLKKSKNKDQIKPPLPSPPVVETPNLEEKKKAAAAFISQKLNSNEEFQTFSKNVGLDVTKDIQDNNGIVDKSSEQSLEDDENGEEISDMEEFEEDQVLCQSTPNLLTESVCEELQIEPPSILNSNEIEVEVEE